MGFLLGPASYTSGDNHDGGEGEVAGEESLMLLSDLTEESMFEEENYFEGDDEQEDQQRKQDRRMDDEGDNRVFRENRSSYVALDKGEGASAFRPPKSIPSRRSTGDVGVALLEKAPSHSGESMGTAIRSSPHSFDGHEGKASGIQTTASNGYAATYVASAPAVSVAEDHSPPRSGLFLDDSALHLPDFHNLPVGGDIERLRKRLSDYCVRLQQCHILSTHISETNQMYKARLKDAKLSYEAER